MARSAGYTRTIAFAKINFVQGKYRIEVFRDGGERAGVERVLVRHHNLATSRALYKAAVKNNPERLVILYDGSQILARSDQPEVTAQPAPEATPPEAPHTKR
jgi:hypothetical protein